jgi:GNAT superfamily N-acetyltransferase
MPFPFGPIRVELDPSSCVRRAQPGDLSGVLAVLSQMHADTPTLSVTAGNRAIFRRILDDDSRVLLVAESTGRIIGTIDLFLLENLSRGGRPWAGIENFVVDEHCRRNGFGRQLLDAAVSVAREAGCYKVQLVSHADRHAAHALYEQAGFTAPVRGYRRYLDV